MNAQTQPALATTILAADLPERGKPLAGGIFIERYWLNGQERALILLPDELTGAWGKYGQDVTGATSHADGAANTCAMAEAGSELAAKVLELGAHIPSCLEAQLLMVAKQGGIAELREDRWHWLSTQYSAHYAFSLDFEDGWQDYHGKNDGRLVRPVRSLLIH